MASPYDYLLAEDFGNWQANVPEAPDNTPPVFDWSTLLTPPTGPPTDVEGATDPTNVDYWSGDGGNAAQNWGAVMIPLAQMMSNNQQFATEFQEASARFWNQNEWSQTRDQFNMDLGERQQSSQEQQALWGQENFQAQLDAQALNDEVSRRVALGELSMAEAQQQIQSGQWEQTFAAQGVNDAHARQMADQQLAFQTEQSDRELTLAEQRQIWQENYQQQEIDARNNESRYAAFGRGSAPNNRWVSNW